MADILEKGLAWLSQMNQAHRATAVVYLRDGQEITLPATIGRTRFELAKDDGRFETFESRDFLVDAKTLVADGQSFLPRPGDRIREEREGKHYVHEVLALGDEPCFRWCDPYRLALRIHTKLVLTEDL